MTPDDPVPVRALDDERRWRRLAAHEAGHAVAGLVLGAEVAWIRIDPETGDGGANVRQVEPWTDAVVAMAGMAATLKASGGWRASPDYHAAVGLVGLERVSEAAARAVELIRANQAAVVAVAQAVMAGGGYLDGARIVEIVQSAKAYS